MELQEAPSLVRALSSQYGRGASKYDEAAMQRWKALGEEGMKALKRAQGELPDAEKKVEFQKAVDALRQADALRPEFTQVLKGLKFAEKCLGEYAPVADEVGQVANDETGEVELLCGEALASWAFYQKVANEHERIAVSKITPEVFLGSRYGIVDGSKLVLDSLQDKVFALSGRPLAAVVNVAALEPEAQYELPTAIACHAVPIKDHVDAQLLPLLDEVVDFIHNHVSRGGACFVHCMGGYSRSSSVLIAYLIKHRGFSYPDAFKVTKRGRPQTKPNDGFVRQLKNFELKCSKRH